MGRLMRRLALCCLTLLAAGCVRSWTHPERTAQDLTRDRAQCEARAAAEVARAKDDPSGREMRYHRAVDACLVERGYR